MKVSILLTPGREKEGEGLLRLFEKEFLEGSSTVIENSWYYQPNCPLECLLRGSTHLILVGRYREFQNHRWFCYVMGFAASKRNFLYFYDPQEIKDVPSPLRGGKTPEDLEKYLYKKTKQWRRELAVQVASSYINELGCSLCRTDFSRAVIEGDRFLCILFLEAGMSPNTQDSEGKSLLVLAIRNQWSDIAKILVEAGADVDLAGSCQGPPPLSEAASKGNLEVVRLLLDHGADLERASKDGQTALICSVGNGHQEIAQFLLDKGADSTKKDNLGMTARDYARLLGKKSEPTKKSQEIMGATVPRCPSEDPSPQTVEARK